MTTYPLYPRGRVSAPSSIPGEHHEKPAYNLIAHLRSICENGDEAMTAAEK